MGALLLLNSCPTAGRKPATRNLDRTGEWLVLLGFFEGEDGENEEFSLRVLPCICR